jgi:hypothetical protein
MIKGYAFRFEPSYAHQTQSYKKGKQPNFRLPMPVDAQEIT